MHHYPSRTENIQVPKVVDVCSPNSCDYAGFNYRQSAQGQLNRETEDPGDHPSCRAPVDTVEVNQLNQVKSTRDTPLSDGLHVDVGSLYHKPSGTSDSGYNTQNSSDALRCEHVAPEQTSEEPRSRGTPFLGSGRASITTHRN